MPLGILAFMLCLITFDVSGGNVQLYLSLWLEFFKIAIFDAILVLESCGGKFTKESGELQSPNHPKDYPNNEECIWFITVPEGAQVSLKFETFEVLLI